MAVDFNEDPGFAPRTSYSRPSGLSGFLIRTGYAKDERQAASILLGLFGACILITLGVWFFSGSSTPSISPQKYMQNATMPQHLPY